MSPYGVLKIYAKGSSGKTVDVHETVIRLEEPRAIGANTKISVRLKDGHAMVINGVGGVMRPGIVHRLDRDTSGLIIAAKNDFSHLALSAQLSDRSLSRVYEAVVHGGFRADSGTVDAPIGRHPADRKKMAVTEKNSRRAVTHWEVIARYAGYTHVRCILQTGRTHQIRVHMAHIGHPLVGDMVYGAGRPEKGLEGQCLHARELKFIHPRTGEPVRVTSELPAYFTDALSRLGEKTE